MVEHPTRAREAWRSIFALLDIAESDAVVIGGDAAEYVAELVPIPLVDTEPRLASLGSARSLAPGADPANTMLEDATIDVALMLGPWDGSLDLAAVVSECARVVRSGGRVVIGRPDVERLRSSTEATYRCAMVMRMMGGAPTSSVRTDRGLPDVELAMVRGRIRELSIFEVDLPIAVLSSADVYVDGVLAGLWPGVEQVPVRDRPAFVAAVRTLLAGEQFPIVEYQPWLITAGKRV